MAKGLCSLPLIPTPSAANRYVPCSVASEHFAPEAFSSSAYPVPIARTPASPTTSSTTPAAQRLLRFMLVLLSSTLLLVGRWARHWGQSALKRLVLAFYFSFR